jgi:hypothetical protein
MIPREEMDYCTFSGGDDDGGGDDGEVGTVRTTTMMVVSVFGCLMLNVERR